MKRPTKKSKKGFTLIELIIVIAILAILALIAIPAYNAYRTSAAIASCTATAKVVYDAALVSDASTPGGDDAGAGWATYASVDPTLTVALEGLISTKTLTVTVTDTNGNVGTVSDD